MSIGYIGHISGGGISNYKPGGRKGSLRKLEQALRVAEKHPLTVSVQLSGFLHMKPTLLKEVEVGEQLVLVTSSKMGYLPTFSLHSAVFTPTSALVDYFQ